MLVAEYQGGSLVKDLAAKFGISRVVDVVRAHDIYFPGHKGPRLAAVL